MASEQLDVLTSARDWLQAGEPVYLVTLVKTFGSAPRPVGSMMAVAGNGSFVGSITGGCVESDLARQITRDRPQRPQIVGTGVHAAAITRAGLPCGGEITLVVEPAPALADLNEVLTAICEHRFVRRTLDIETGRTIYSAAAAGDRLQFDGAELVVVHGLPWRLFVIGANQLGRYLAVLAQTVDFDVSVCDSRFDYLNNWRPAGETLHREPPEDTLQQQALDHRCAVVAVGHEPNLEDLALCVALESDAFFVGALGSRGNHTRRSDRLLRYLGVDAGRLERLRGPVGLPIGSRTPAEIAVSIVAELIAARSSASTADIVGDT